MILCVHGMLLLIFLLPLVLLQQKSSDADLMIPVDGYSSGKFINHLDRGYFSSYNNYYYVHVSHKCMILYHLIVCD